MGIELPPGAEGDEDLGPLPDPNVRSLYFGPDQEAPFVLAEILDAGWRFITQVGPTPIQVGRVGRNGQPPTVLAWMFFFERVRPGARWPQFTEEKLRRLSEQAQALLKAQGHGA